MATVNIKDYDVKFPYEKPYDLQKVYMEKVITCLDEGKHGVLESPTGTGKTLCLFAPVATWVTKQKIKNELNPHSTKEDPDYCHDQISQNVNPSNSWGNKHSRIWYTSRTHSQIAQSVAEVRRCDIEDLKIVVLGARDQLCINPDVLSEKESYVKTIKCKELVKSKGAGGCKYYRKYEANKRNEPNPYKTGIYRAGEVKDIEDMVSTGKSCGMCPYYMSKDASSAADIILLPYNYIIDKDAREGNQLNLSQDVIIFDEGHNVPSTCEESYEFQLTSVDLAVGAENVRMLMEALAERVKYVQDEEEEAEISAHAANAQFIMTILKNLQSGLDRMPASKELLPVGKVHEFFEQSGINVDTSAHINSAIESFKTDATRLSLTGNVLAIFYLLERMTSVVFGPIISLFDAKTIDRSFKCGITMEEDRAAKSKKMSLFCFNPSFGIRTLLQLGVKSIIITSGTLSPLTTFIYELSLPDPVTLENGHIAKKSQVPFMIINNGVGGVAMDGSFKNRTDPKYIASLGNTLTNLISSVPDGVLLLFSSYSMMNNLKDAWESNNGIWNRLNNLKRVFIEPRGKDDFINCMENYRRAVDSGNGAILMGVLRGKISEGMDFKDQYCRGVFIIGVPFPPVMDPRVKGKEKYAETLMYLNPKTNREEKLYQNSFLSIEAMKATNQAIGRVIRHGQDYGAIVLVDHRFSGPRLFYNISSWLRGPRPVEYNFTEAKKILREFFKNVNSGKLNIPEVRCQRVDANGCPVASYVSYEEFDIRTQKRTPAPNIVASVSNKNSSGRALVEYIDLEDEPISIVSSYINQDNNVNFIPQTQPKASSFLDALESSRGSSIGYRTSDLLKEETYKRKFELSEVNSEQTVKSPRLEKKSLKLFSKVVIPILPPSEAKEPESVLPVGKNKMASTATNQMDYLSSLSNQKENNEVKEIKQEDLVKQYFQTVKGKVSGGLYIKFAHAWAKYGKSESQLSEVIAILKDLVVASKDPCILNGFKVCVKKKDLEVWTQLCKENVI